MVSTISSSRSPLQPPEADEGEPFTTYFDSKIPIPEDETVSGETPLEKSASEPPESFPRHQFPFQAGLEMEIWRGGLRGWEGRGGGVSCRLGHVSLLMIDPLGFGSCQRARKGLAMLREGPGLFAPLSGAGALAGLVTLTLSPRDAVPSSPQATAASGPWLEPPVPAASQGGPCFPLGLHEHDLGCPKP